jgi:hypothetical protein
MYHPVVFWSRKTSRFYRLDAYTGCGTLSIAPPDRIMCLEAGHRLAWSCEARSGHGVTL